MVEYWFLYPWKAPFIADRVAIESDWALFHRLIAFMAPYYKHLTG